MSSFVKEIFIESDTEPIPITQQTPEVCKVSTRAEDSNIDPKRISSLEVHTAALKSSLMDEIYDLKNQIECSNTEKARVRFSFFFTGANKIIERGK